jgi:hypothetical protein
MARQFRSRVTTNPSRTLFDGARRERGYAVIWKGSNAMTDLAHERQQAHAYLDRLPPAQLSAVPSLLGALLNGRNLDRPCIAISRRRTGNMI